MKIRRDFEQNSVDWQIARSGVVTASEADALVSPTFEIRKGQMPETYLFKKLAESWLGGPLPSSYVFDMEQGTILEREALPYYEFQTNEKVERVGFITTDDGRCGCSPDGLFKDGSGIEIKCPRIETHINYLLAGILPKEYAMQVHFSMFVTGARNWKFMSYRRKLPPLILTIDRNESVQETIAKAVAMFEVKFDMNIKRLEQFERWRLTHERTCNRTRIP